ncbi:hypothetical protein PRK78_006424 [Emydomyces testavorans]|uniref:EF-hand domain-containing protein n=1 Tax=Emydomyces testavorans TaxID=2070801 RepID=A0AAF0DP53_9EURO|nr:hypothetical protein PRK78_006424 [Emydomyces testavorans]
MVVVKSSLISLLVAVLPISAHVPEVPSNAKVDWATRHMIGLDMSSFSRIGRRCVLKYKFMLTVEFSLEEHHISNFDAGSFFAFHDYDGSGTWTPDEVRRTYGLDDESNINLTEDRKRQILIEVFAIFDPHKTGIITQENWVRLYNDGWKLPDFGVGPGHHGDMEYEYEIHHFEKYHGDDAKPEDLTHPEDIEHFKKHDHDEDSQHKLEEMQSMSIVEENIPAKFRRHDAS